VVVSVFFAEKVEVVSGDTTEESEFFAIVHHECTGGHFVVIRYGQRDELLWDVEVALDDVGLIEIDDDRVTIEFDHALLAGVASDGVVVVAQKVFCRFDERNGEGQSGQDFAVDDAHDFGVHEQVEDAGRFGILGMRNWKHIWAVFDRMVGDLAQVVEEGEGLVEDLCVFFGDLGEDVDDDVGILGLLEALLEFFDLRVGVSLLHLSTKKGQDGVGVTDVLDNLVMYLAKATEFGLGFKVDLTLGVDGVGRPTAALGALDRWRVFHCF